MEDLEEIHKPSEGIRELFKETGALLNGHFVLTSGLHSESYLQCALVLQYPKLAERLGQELASSFKAEHVESVIAPAIGGIIVAHEVARALGIRALFTEREAGAMTLRRGFTVRDGERVLIVEDVVTTGGSTRETIQAAVEAGATVVGAGSIVDRSGGKADVGVRRVSLLSLSVPAYSSDQCPLCKQGLPAVKPGSRKNLKIDPS
ncbi:MAG: orotate phosphoribosyltransferase [Blastocatellia bacterium AA13]|nr:MAG: orotate phosphoribosyltransferase [Blastocatellia bacterium AA13]